MIYLFEHPETGELRDVCFDINDEKVYVDDSGVTWDRRWTLPQLSIDTKIDPFSQKQFLEKTSKGGTVGDLMDRSAELSAMRTEKAGRDDAKEKYDAQEAAFRGGKRPAKKLKDIEITAKIK